MSKYSISSNFTFKFLDERYFYVIQILSICTVLPDKPPMIKRGPLKTTVIPWTTTGQMPGNHIIIRFSTVVK